MEQFLPFIILAIVSFLFSNKKSEQKKKPTAPRPIHTPLPSSEVQTFERVEEVEPDSETLKKVVDIKESFDDVIEEKKPNSTDYQKNLEAKFEKLKKEEERQLNKAQSLLRTEQTIDHEPSHPLKQVDFTPNSVVNGIIMSEVLGPPRARRHVQRNRR